jgi:hypothetical protein
MSFDFELTSEEVDEFFKDVGSRFNQALPISLSFGRKGAPSFRVRKQGQAQKLLAAKGTEIAQFVALPFVRAVACPRSSAACSIESC